MGSSSISKHFRLSRVPKDLKIKTKLYIKYHTSDQSIIFRLHAFHFSKFADLLNEVCKNLKRFLIPTQMLHYYKKMYLLIGLDYSHIFFHFRYVYVECKIKF